ncbi:MULTISPECIES: ATP-binding cassette domain-containing protein [unclassified Nocardioides]|uniref:branched-chain amino acid ABC transporter ATP-binding protein/permease n=1 Tax=unclassified Nocardioides TaxID=2615069 RepID=UPI00005717B8|nr:MULTISPECIES: ATP-binding cassette domain-containing protein [unclassified Nocardioides]ABL81655.1 amino acid/amide ABC transporter ATP-binding protein 1, HAAT family / amino acid/amide ABC transporter membrane protein 2, HAAT family [Nocardioides sp. JS614]
MNESTVRHARSATPVLIAIAVFALLVASLGDSYRTGILSLAVVYGIALVGMHVQIGYAGELSLGAVAFMAVGAYGSGVLTTEHDMNPLAAIGVSLLISLGAALIIGSLCLRISELTLALVTLFMVIIVEQLVSHLDAFGGTFGISGIEPLEVFGYSFESRTQQAVLAGVVLLAVWLFARYRLRALTGLEVVALSHDATMAESLGVAVRRRRLEVFVFGALVACLAGSVFAHTRLYVSPDQFGPGLIFELLLMMYIGGLRFLLGGFLGALILGFLPDIAISLQDYLLIIEGVLFLAIFALVRDRGLIGFVGQSVARVLPSSVREAPHSVVKQTALTVLRPTSADASLSGGASLKITGASKSFGGVKAVSDVDLTIGSRGIHAVIGPNGAGKTSLFNLVSGLSKPDDGSIEIFGQNHTSSGPVAIARAGLARTFQTVRLSEQLTVLDNVAVGSALANNTSFFRLGDGKQLGAARARAMAILNELEIAQLANRMPSELSLADQRFVELARALCREPKLLLLDEPASGLSDEQRRTLAHTLTRVGQSLPIVLVEHDMNFVRSVASQVTVLVGGSVLLTALTGAALSDPAVIAAYLGEPLDRVDGTTGGQA